MYAVADFYSALNLKKLTNKKFRDAVREYWNSNDFTKTVEIVYTTTTAENRGLRQIIKRILINRRELLDKPEIEVVIKEVPNLAFDILRGIRGHSDNKLKEFKNSGVEQMECKSQ